jgi:hypothetical protein
LYRGFWVQLMEWCATSMDFLPGQDYAVRLRDTSHRAGQAVRATISYRGTASDPRPFVRIARDGKPFSEAAATELPGAGGGREWMAVVVPPEPGRYEVSVGDRTVPGLDEGRVVFEVPAPPAEDDDLRPDPEFLRQLAARAGGHVFAANAVDGLKSALWAERGDAARAQSHWEALWPRWWGLLAVGLCFGGEWWMRRREGLS